MQLAELQAEVAELKFDRSKWKPTKFGEVVACVDKTCRNPAEVGLTRIVGLDNLDPGELQIKRWGDLSDGTSFTRSFRAGQVLFGKRRAYQRKVALADFDGICSGDILVFEPRGEGLAPELLPFLVQSEAFFKHALGTSAGSLSPRTKWKEIAKWEFVLPAREGDQRRISDLIWATENSVRTLEATLRDADVLSHAIRTSQLSKVEDLRTVADLVKDGIIAAPQDGNHGELHPKACDYVSDGIPFLMANNIRNGIVDLLSCKFLNQSITDKLRIGFAFSGDVLLTHKGTVGEVAILPEMKQPYAMLTPQVTYYRVLDRKRLIPEFLAIQLSSASVREQMRILASAGTRDYIGIKAQRGLRLSCPPIEVQEELVTKLRAINAAQEACGNQIARTRELKRMLVDCVFEGVV